MLLNDADLKIQTNVNTSFSHGKLIPAIRNVENREIKHLLGPTLYGSLNTSYNTDPQVLTDKQKALLEYVQPVVANLAMWQFAGKGTMLIDDNGFSVTSTEQIKPASETKIENFKTSCMNAGFNGVDDLIEFLEDNAGDYPDWVSEASGLARAFFIASAKTYHEYVNIRESRRMYLLLLPIMRRVETHEIMATICKELFDEIKDQLESDTLSPTNAALLGNLKGAVAHLTWGKALNELALSVNDQGIHLMNNSFSGTVKGLVPAEANRIRVAQDEHARIGQGYLENVKDYLQANADDYPLYKASECYIDETLEETGEFENDPDSGMMML